MRGPEVAAGAKLAFPLDDYDLERSAQLLAGFGQDRFGYVVTPNVDHVIRCYEDADFRNYYRNASYVLLDSRFLAHILRMTRGLKLPVCTGSDMTAQLFSKVMRPHDQVVLIGGREWQAQQLIERFGLKSLRHFDPPMGFIRSPEQVEATLQFIEAHSPFRFCVIAVGTPQGEMLAQMLKTRARCRGLTLCVGASIDFLTGVVPRAPLWMRRLGLEWLYRLARSPKRLANRYLVKGPRVFALLPKIAFELRPAGGDP